MYTRRKKYEEKKLVICFILIAIIILVGGIFVFQNFNREKVTNKDAIKFKEEYESLNEKINENNGKEYRSISISEDNPFIYKEADDIVEMINNKETFAVYFGFNSCPWCRSVIPSLIEVAKDTEVEKIYYVDVKEIRDTIEMNDNGELETTKEGTDGYYKLIELMKNVLSDYTITDSNGNKVPTGEKRIYAPNVVIVIDGVAEKLESGISEQQTDGYMELNDEIKKDTYSKFESILEYMYVKQHTCNEGC